MKKLCWFILLVCCNLSYGQNDFVIKNVKLFDGEKVHEKTSVHVRDGKIIEVGKRLNAEVTIINGEGKTLLPALSNAHVHAWMPANLQEAAKAGVLNVFDMHGVEMVQPMMKVFKDSVNYANYFVAGAAATAPEGHGTQYGFPTPTLTKPEEAEKFVNDRINAGADYIKIIVEPWRKTLSHETVKVLIKQAHLKNRTAVVHISKVSDAVNVLTNDANGLVHIWWDKPISQEQLKKLTSQKKFFIIPTLLTTHKVFGELKKKNPEAEIMLLPELQKEVKKLHDAGVTILAGTDPPNAQINYSTDLYHELKLISEAGVPNLEVLKGATSATSKAFKLQNRGMIAKGYIADMLLVDGDPIENIDNIEKVVTVWKAGEKVKR